MKRIIDEYLIEWKDSKYRKPLLLRGARQVGKTYSIRKLGNFFDTFIEINFESDKEFKNIFDKDLDPVRIVRDISLKINKRILPGKSLIFFDEIQSAPEALTALRYFYEKLPSQHIIAAGSLLDFTIKSVGIPVGRVSSLYMYPLSFFEFLCASNYNLLAEAILNCSIQKPMSESVHKKLFVILGEYLAIGGMPEAVFLWSQTKDPLLCFKVHHSLIDTYRQDFNKYAEKFQIKYLNLLFNSISFQLGKKFKYSVVEGDFRKRELVPSNELLVTAGIINQVFRSAGNGVPLGAEVDPSDFKIIFLDVALSQTILGLDLKTWFLNPQQEMINKGTLVESFVGQEFLVYNDPNMKANLFYWRRNVPGSEAEVDYLIQDKNQVVPVEVKSGSGKTLKSMNMFLESHKKSTYGLRFSIYNYSTYNKIHSYPLYAIASAILANQNQGLKKYEALLLNK